MANFKTYFTFCLSLLLLSGCKDKVEIPAETESIRDKIVAVVFNTGSWWRYSLVSSVGYDTVEVISVKHDTAKYIASGVGYNIEYYKADYRIKRNGFVYSCYYYRDRAKFNCIEPDIVNTGQEFFFTNDTVGIGGLRGSETNCCRIEGKYLYETYNGVTFSDVRAYYISPECQWDKKLIPYGAAYKFCPVVGFLQFYLGSGLGWQEDHYEITSHHIEHL